jgi:hypothetical protein
MQSALVATLARPEWWAMALAAFLVRGGFFLIVLPIVSIPTAAGIISAVSPTLEGIWLGKPSLDGVLVGSLVITLVLAGLMAAALAGSWLDLALVREATEDEDVDRGWRSTRPSILQALSIRLTAHVPTLLAIAYGSLRLVDVGYSEFTSPSDAGVPIVDRILVRVPDVVLLLLAAWLIGETVGSLAARRAASGTPASRAITASVRQVLSPRGLATLGLTSGAILGLMLPFVVAASRSWDNLRVYLLAGADPVEQGAALVLLVASWVLGLAILGAALAWRATVWTSEVQPA